MAKKTKKNSKKFEYRSYSFRLNDETYKKLKNLRYKAGKSWNLFFYNLTKENDKKRQRRLDEERIQGTQKTKD